MLTISSEGTVRTHRRPDPSTIAFLAIAAGAYVFLLSLGRGLTFFWDEWSWIVNRQDWSFSSLMAPYNEHWSLVPLLIYKTLLATVGLRSYLPLERSSRSGGWPA